MKTRLVTSIRCKPVGGQGAPIEHGVGLGGDGLEQAGVFQEGVKHEGRGAGGCSYPGEERPEHGLLQIRFGKELRVAFVQLEQVVDQVPAGAPLLLVVGDHDGGQLFHPFAGPPQPRRAQYQGGALPVHMDGEQASERGDQIVDVAGGGNAGGEHGHRLGDGGVAWLGESAGPVLADRHGAFRGPSAARPVWYRRRGHLILILREAQAPPFAVRCWPGQPSACSPLSRAFWMAAAASSVTHWRQTPGLLPSHQAAASAWLAWLSIRHITIDAYWSASRSHFRSMAATSGARTKRSGVRRDQKRCLVVGAGLAGRPALLAVGGLLQPDHVQEKGGGHAAVQVTKPRLASLVKLEQAAVQLRLRLGDDDVDMVGEPVPFDLGLVDRVTRPPLGTGNQPGPAAAPRGREQLPVPVILQILDAVQARIRLLQVGGDHERRLRQPAQALPQRNRLPGHRGFLPRLARVRQPQLHHHVNAAPPQSRDSRLRTTLHHTGRKPIALLHDVLGNTVLQQRAIPTKITKHNRGPRATRPGRTRQNRANHDNRRRQHHEPANPHHKPSPVPHPTPENPKTSPSIPHPRQQNPNPDPETPPLPEQHAGTETNTATSTTTAPRTAPHPPTTKHSAHQPPTA